jgi:hypothetical protein
MFNAHCRIKMAFGIKFIYKGIDMNYYKSIAVLSCVFSSALFTLPVVHAADMGRVSHAPKPEVSDMSRVSKDAQQEKSDMGRLSQSTPTKMLKKRPAAKVAIHLKKTQKYRG